MAQVSSLRGVASGCAKKGCRNLRTQRHHLRHQAMFLGVWAGRRRREQKWKEFIERYNSFLDEDCVRVCPKHHAEIHSIYDQIIAADIQAVNRTLAHYTWRQAERLMDKLEAACREWLRTQTPGIDPHFFSKYRQARRRNV